MTSAYCPHCGEIRADVSRSIEKCTHCGGLLPDCPKCHGRNVGFIDVDLMGCYSCRHEFRPPTELRNKGKESDRTEWNFHWEVIGEEELIARLKPDQLRFVLEVAEKMADRIPNFPHYNPFNPSEGHPDPARNYLGLYLRHYVKIGQLLQLRKSFSNSPNRRLRNAKYFAEEVLAPTGVLFHPNETVRLEWARVVRQALIKILGLRTKLSIKHSITERIIRDCYKRRSEIPHGQLHQTIARELDANDDACLDPRLAEWKEEIATPGLDWQGALTNDRLKARVKKLFSTVGRSD